MAVNLSDIAAMGAEPRLALLSLALPPALSCEDFDAMIGGLTALASRHRVHVVGGNLTRSPGPLMLDVTVVGTVKPRQVIQRQGAHPGDFVYVTGSIGAASAGLHMLKAAQSRATEDAGGDRGQLQQDAVSCVQRYLYPEPRVREGLLLGRNRAATAGVDLSDGLADGVHQIAAASGVGIDIDAGTLPIDQEARRWFEAHGEDAVIQAVSAGDDYELVFTGRPGRAGRLKGTRFRGAAPVTKIGVCTNSPDVTISSGAGQQPMPRGYKHFR
jgi:thiamine-monophosphate kinase